MAEQKKMGFTHDDKKNKTVDWYTPAYVFDELGVRFDLDPCAPEGGVPWIPADRHYALPTDGLAEPWEGFVWCNPPYGKETEKWLSKMASHRNGVALVFARTDTLWFHRYAKYADALLFIKGRIAFVDGLGATGEGGAGAGSLLIGWGDAGYAAVCKAKKMGFLIDNRQNTYGGV